MTLNATRGLARLLHDAPASLRGDALFKDSSGTRANSDAGRLVHPSDPSFCDAVEDGVRPVVVLLCDRLCCVTYSSCEGHLDGHDITPAHVGIVAADDERRAALLGRLQQLIAGISGDAVPRLIVGSIEDDRGTVGCVDMVFHGTGVSGPRYLKGVRTALDEIVRRLCRLPTTGSVLPMPEFLGGRPPPELASAPYPWLCLAGLFDRETMAIVAGEGALLPRSRGERRGYSLGAAGVTHGSLFRAFDGPMRSVVSRIVGRSGIRLDALEFHDMVAADFVSVHTDQPNSDRVRMWRLVVYLDDVPPEVGGAHVVLEAVGGRYLIRAAVQPTAGDALLFEMTPSSFHAVTPLSGGMRRTLVATYGS
ncbi:2OG-Fe(II) oxygenase [Sphingomonas phyllosphaerae]|uniref:2OG-Fe(II) oxygenase n=1 Tax=Sphingomonas phyllosphaerae TaxID=257003 RepID=UPI00241370EB|nr:2OG-Fe(II) oxygenase [Sphingomonas phyllosphaerae]